MRSSSSLVGSVVQRSCSTDRSIVLDYSCTIDAVLIIYACTEHRWQQWCGRVRRRVTSRYGNTAPWVTCAYLLCARQQCTMHDSSLEYCIKFNTLYTLELILATYYPLNSVKYCLREIAKGSFYVLFIISNSSSNGHFPEDWLKFMTVQAWYFRHTLLNETNWVQLRWP